MPSSGRRVIQHRPVLELLACKGRGLRLEEDGNRFRLGADLISIKVPLRTLRARPLPTHKTTFYHEISNDRSQKFRTYRAN